MSNLSLAKKEPFSLTGKRLWIAGNTGLVGMALIKRLQQENCSILTISHTELDLRDQAQTNQWVKTNKPDVVILAAGTVGGIQENRTKPVNYLYDNLMIGTNVIRASARYGVQKLLNLGSSCFYPTQAAQPIKETDLLTGALETTNEAYAIAKIATTKLCQAYFKQFNKDFITVVPTNLFGEGDHFDDRAHVISALIKKFHQASQNHSSEVEIWGSGRPEREFLYIDDAVDAMVFLLKNYHQIEPINIAGGEIVSIAQLAQTLGRLFEFEGKLSFDVSKPDGMMKKSLDGSKLSQLGWKPQVSFLEGLKKSIHYYLNTTRGVR